MTIKSKHHLSVYDIRSNWGKRFKPLIPAVEKTLRRAIRTIRYDFDPRRDIPREAGWRLDCPWPRSRTGASAFHMYGYCHVIAVVMLDFAQRSMPDRNWLLHNAQRHTVVIDAGGSILDINASHSEPRGVIDQVWSQCLLGKPTLYASVDEYLTYRLESYPFGAPKAMRPWLSKNDQSDPQLSLLES